MVDRIQNGNDDNTVVHEGDVAQGDVAFKKDPASKDPRAVPGVNRQATDVSSVGEDGKPVEPQNPIEARRASFDAEQDARKRQFEREANADINRMERDKQVTTERMEREQKLNARKQELLEKSFEDGLLTQNDLERQRALLAPHTQQGVMAPHEALGRDEDTVLMAFPRAVTLTMSASDIKRMNNLDEDEPAVTGSISHGARVHFSQGYNDVPVGLADHAYLHAAGAYRCDDDGKPETVADREKRLSEKRHNKGVEKKAEVKAEAKQVDKDAATL